jgi:hypothetical protein
MHWKKSVCLVTLVSLVVMVMAGCTKSGEFGPSASEQATRPEGWAEETHSNNVDPDYETVFPQDKVNQIKITITPEDWNAMQANMVELLGNDPPKGGIAPDKAQVPRAPGQQGRINM